MHWGGIGFRRRSTAVISTVDGKGGWEIVYFSDLPGAFEDRDCMARQRNSDCSAEAAEARADYYDLRSVNAGLPGLGSGENRR
jgi:hypothetical protein